MSSKEDCARKVSLAFRVVSTLICCICFLALCWEQINQFFARETGVSQSWEQRVTRKFPLVAFCAERGFRSEVVNLFNIRQNREWYLSESVPINVTYRGKMKSDYEFYEIKPGDYEVFDLYTYYRGPCKVFRIKKDVEAFESYSFILSGEQNYLMYLLDEGEEIFLSGDDYIFPVVMLNIQSSANVRIRPTVYHSTSEFLRCTDYTMKEYKDCLLDIFLVTNNGTGCRDILGEPFIPQVPYCDVHNITIEVQVFEAEEEEILGLTFDFRDMSATHQILLHFVREGLHGKDGQCFIPCKTNTYETEHLPLHYFDEEALGGRIVYITYATQFDSINKEYLLHNFGSITAAVGGAVGLFLGSSLLSVFNKLNDIALQWMLRRNSLTPVKPLSPFMK